jgi:peptidoglycan/LPS O-acetylase OafA/YrhL
VKKLIPLRETSAPERNNFDAIRLAMALLVVWSHSFALHLGSERTEWISLVLSGCYNAGNLGVMAFFVISGFLITQSWERSKSARSYFEKRVRRIYPGYMVATSICAFIIAPLFGGPFPSWLKTIGLNLLLRNEVSAAFASNPAPNAVNGSLWSIPFEFWCYIGVAIAGTMLIKRRRLLVILCITLMVGKIAQDVTGRFPSGLIGTVIGWPYLWTKIAPSFLLGMIVYAYRAGLPRSWVVFTILWFAAIGACWTNRHIADLLIAPSLAYSVFMVGFSHRLRAHDAAKYGDFSYGTYLYAFPIQQMLQATTHLTLAEFIVTSMALSLLAGVLSWILVEKRFMVRRVRPLRQPQTPRLGTEALALEPRPLPERQVQHR